MTSNQPESGYAPVNGLQMYYEIHGSGEPLVVIPGSFMSLELMGQIVPALAQHRKVIGVEVQGHGHTGDIDRAFTYENLADDVAALLRHLNIAQADVYGYSLGGGIALQMGVRHPGQVRKLVVVSSPVCTEGHYPEVTAALRSLTPEMFDGSPFREAYNRVAPNPDAFATMVRRMNEATNTPFDWTEAVGAMSAPTLTIIGDADGMPPEHAAKMFRLGGGGVFGDMAGIPASRFAVLPGTSHLGLLDRAAWIAPMVEEFLSAPMPEPAPADQPAV